MSLTALVIGGIVFTTVSVIGKVVYNSTEEARKQEKKQQLLRENELLNSVKDYVGGVKSKLTKSKQYLTDARRDFKNGGHVDNDVPLANSEFNSCISDLDNAIRNATNIINSCNSNISKNNREIKKLGV